MFTQYKSEPHACPIRKWDCMCVVHLISGDWSALCSAYITQMLSVTWVFDGVVDGDPTCCTGGNEVKLESEIENSLQHVSCASTCFSPTPSPPAGNYSPKERTVYDLALQDFEVMQSSKFKHFTISSFWSHRHVKLPREAGKLKCIGSFRSK